jgi:phosphoribosylformimino-5-aminoimidazole carboxamide ribotide isomerase
VSLPDPVEMARHWRSLGFRSLHVVDLDAALDLGSNRGLISRIAQEVPGDLQVGGGIRDVDTASELVSEGADRVIVGTRAVDDPAWLETLAGRLPGKVIVAADVRNGRVLRRGWTEASDLAVSAFLETLASLPLAGILCTDVSREGRVEGIDRDGVEEILSVVDHPIWISGGITSLEELRYLREHEVTGAVMGMALYTGALNAERVAKEFGR